MRQYLPLPRLLCILFVVSGCANQPNQPLNYYVLSLYSDVVQLSQLQPQSTQKTTQLVFAHLTLPRYLRQDSLVYLTSDTTMFFATKHLWAEPLHESIPKVIMASFNAIDGTQLLDTRAPIVADMPTLRLDIQHFYADFTGHVVLQGEYWLQADISSHQNSKSQHYFFQFSLPLEQSGYAQTVKQQRQLLGLLARHIHTNYKQF